MDKGTARLLDDIKGILRYAEQNEYHDFKNTNFATPKMQLVAHLEEIIGKVKNGWYDNFDY